MSTVYAKMLEQVHQAYVDHRLAGGTDQPARIELHPESLENLLIDGPPMKVVSHLDGQPKLHGIPLQGDPRIPLGQIRVIWT